MHPLIIGAAVVVVAVLLLMRRREPATKLQPVPWDSAGTGTAGPRRLAFVSRGKLFYSALGEPPREVHSPHVQAATDRVERSRQLHGWKEGTSLGVNFIGRQQGAAGADVELQATSAQFVGDDRIVYFLRDASMGGLFEQDLATGVEKRLLHRRGLLLDDLRSSADGRQLLCAQHSGNGAANVAVVGVDGEDYRELTGGDTLDTAPSWVPGKPDLVVFQSSGLARAQQGGVVARGSTSIQLLDTTRGSLTAVLDDARYDYLQPRVAPDGSLLFIRRPYEAAGASAGNALLDALLFPFRLLRALFHFLNFFSLMYSRKPLTSASGPEMQGDLKDILVQGKRIDAEAALRRGNVVHGVPSLVPASWVLMCRNEQGEERALATHVASFDLAPDGTIVYSSGYGVLALGGGGAPRVVLRDKLIAGVVAG